MIEKAAELWYYKQIGGWIILTLVMVSCLIRVVVSIWNDHKKGR